MICGREFFQGVVLSLGKEVGVFEVVVVGDSLWRPPLFFGSTFVVAGSSLSVGFFRCFRVF